MKITTRRFHVSATRPEDFPRDARPHVAMMGRSNVGKSSLLNRLLGERGLARTSKAPGRTRALNFFLANERVYFVDLPGYGYARVPDRVREEWKDLVEAYLAGPGRPDLALQLLDARHEPTGLDRELLDWLEARGVRHEIVLTKVDKLSGNERTRMLLRAARWIGLPPGRHPLAVSAVTGDGIPALWRVIDEVCAGRPAHQESAPPPGGGASPENTRAARSGEPGARTVILGGRYTL